MAKDFICPYCKGNLNIEDEILLAVRNHDAKRGLISLSPEIGKYETKTHPSFSLSQGEHNDFFCPICHANLAALEFNENLAKVLMMDENKQVYEILFSGIEGEHCTYKIHNHDIESFGEDSQTYMNHFGEFPKY
jgi:uncharacterized protein YbaR (Trm112 family)